MKELKDFQQAMAGIAHQQDRARAELLKLLHYVKSALSKGLEGPIESGVVAIQIVATQGSYHTGWVEVNSLGYRHVLEVYPDYLRLIGRNQSKRRERVATPAALSRLIQEIRDDVARRVLEAASK